MALLNRAQVNRTCVVCRRTGDKKTLVRFSIFEDSVSLSLKKQLQGRGFYVHPTCFGSKKILTSMEYQLKRFRCCLKKHSFLFKSVKTLSLYLKEQISDCEGSSEVGFSSASFSSVEKVKMEEALRFLEKNSFSKKEKSQKIDLTNKGDLAKKKIRL